MTLKEKLRDFLISRKQAYIRVFNPESVYAQKVLEDLARFCRANESAFHSDARLHGVLEGRREVWLRIISHTKLDQDSFLVKYGKGET